MKFAPPIPQVTTSYQKHPPPWQASPGALLREGRLQVPFNQRSYAWREKHVRNLFQDLDEEIERGDGSEYVLGTIVLIQKGNEPPTIVDGQQRLATVSILLARIRDQLVKLNKGASASAIEESFQIRTLPISAGI